jgi:hypothetical protein
MRNAWHVCDRAVCASVINHTKSPGRISMGAADLAARIGCVIYAPSELLATGGGHRVQIGDCMNLEIERVEG